jgi:hypothetical protein
MTTPCKHCDPYPCTCLQRGIERQPSLAERCEANINPEWERHSIRANVLNAMQSLAAWLRIEDVRHLELATSQIMVALQQSRRERRR